MSWNYTDSRQRIQQHLDSMGEIEVKKLVRAADLDELLTETRCREIYGSHVYIQVSNFTHLATQEPDTPDSYKQLIQMLHIYQREVSRIIESANLFDGFRVHFQGPKVHALFYRPIDDGEKLATKAILLQLVLKDFVKSVFNPAFADSDDFTIAGGADQGDVIGTRNGSNGDRELLFLGAPANHSAKIISSAGRLRLTESVYAAAPLDLQAVCCEVGEGLYQIGRVSQSDLDDLLGKYGVGWDRIASSRRVEGDKRQFPLSVINYSSADVKINLDDLSIRNNKRVLAASVFGDITGFTAYIDSANTDRKKGEALRVFHAIRREMARVVKVDFDGLRIQFQGDRVQGLFHLPKGDEEAIAKIATDVAVGLQSSMEKSIKDCLPEAGELRLAAGVDVGTTLVSKLGTRGHRDRICIGEAVEAAAGCEERCDGGQIGITSPIYNALREELRNHFSWDASARCYVAADLTADKVERTAAARRLDAGAPLYVQSGGAGVTVSNRQSPGARPVTPARSYAE
jgi:class 3 adenylate cyclase